MSDSSREFLGGVQICLVFTKSAPKTRIFPEKTGKNCSVQSQLFEIGLYFAGLIRGKVCSTGCPGVLQGWTGTPRMVGTHTSSALCSF